MDPYLVILSCAEELPFNVGRKLLCDVLKGRSTEKTKKLRLEKKISYAALCLEDDTAIESMIGELSRHGYLEQKTLQGYIKVLSVTEKGRAALREKKISLKKAEAMKILQVTDEDRAAFASLGSALHGLSDEQKKCVIEAAPHILCIAGAGTGKTRVLTKRAHFLARYRNVPEEKILAITFTRKARREMHERLRDLAPNVQVETFNSFCERMLREHELSFYGRRCEVLDYPKKIRMISQILSEMKLTPEAVLAMYFDEKKRSSEDHKTLFLSFMNDLFSAFDYKSNATISDADFLGAVEGFDGEKGRVIRRIMEMVIRYKKDLGLRDYTDQLVHCIGLFQACPDKIPRYQHILIDEYQDVNDLQIRLIDLLAPENLFAVGDPRQSIFGWRGSKPSYILGFNKRYPDAKILSLTLNYRSGKRIVELANDVIRRMGLPELKSSLELGAEDVKFISHESERAQGLFVAESILSQGCRRKDIFVLARTNRELADIEPQLAERGIRFVKRTVEEQKTDYVPSDDEVTISTVHAIKGLEAETVYLIGANTSNFPCRASDHPLLEAIKANDDYDKKEEELRLLYVALTRARKRLVVNYYSALTQFFPERALAGIVSTAGRSKERSLYDMLREWRLAASRTYRILPYQIFSDRTLMQLCEDRPNSVEDLTLIYGMGPAKISRFGEEIIEMIRNAPDR